MAGMARRMIAVATSAMPSSRRDWGRAISAELEHVSGRGEQVRLVLAAVRVVLVPPSGCWGYGRAVSRSVQFALVAYLPLGVGLYVSNVVIRPAQDSAAGVFMMDGYLLLTLLVAGALARRATPEAGAPVVAGLAVGLVLAVLGLATLAWLDNAFFSAVSQQQDTIDSFRQSGMTSMHGYLTSHLESTALGVIVILTLAGAIFAPIGAALSAEASRSRALLARRSGARTARHSGVAGHEPDM